jgi:uncharacterized protein YndB with AHSA1/START domain
MDNYGTVNESGVLRMERILPAPIERVWSYFVEPEKRATWLAGGTMAHAPGGRIELDFNHIYLSGERAPERFGACNDRIQAISHVVRIDPPRLLVMSWDDGGPAESEVSFELTPENAHATRLVLTHRRLPDRSQLLSHSTGWHTHLDTLETVLQGRKMEKFWTHFMELEAVYDKRLPA